MAEVKFKRIEDSADINDVPITDGQLIYTKNGVQFMDYGTDRINLTSVLSSVEGTIVWQNEHPEYGFAETNITLDDDNYDMYLFICQPGGSEGNVMITDYFVKNWGTLIQYSGELTRKIMYVNNNIYKITDCVDRQGVTENNWIIPLYVIGYKTNIFS